ncbi:MAG: Conserved exported protein of unknown function [Rickettsiaceae bacterium]|jgi:hypothetical protein|nr:Conserved exported protein of unknown function [Rickettsiaceae bacterium]
MHKKKILTVLFAVYLCSFSASANEEKPEEVTRKYVDKKGIVTLAWENDMFAGEDNHYTNGARISYLSGEERIPHWLQRVANFFPMISKRGHKRWHLDIGQSMFTPSNITDPDPQRYDRPYAGWLYGGIGIISETGKRLDSLLLTLGMVGPSSLAKQTQKTVHSAIGSPDPKGWNYQLKDEPGAVLTYERKWRELYELGNSGFGVDITPSIGASAGNVFTNAGIGAVIRLGYDLPADYGPPLIRPNLPGSDFFLPRRSVGYYIFAGVDGRAVARNIFLDGNTFRDSQSVDKETFVGGLQLGAAISFKDARIAYTHVINTKEFTTQKHHDEFGAVTVSMRF